MRLLPRVPISLLHSYVPNAQTISIHHASQLQPTLNTKKTEQDFTSLPILQRHSAHPPHHHTLCSLQALQIFSLLYPCFNLICQHTLDTGPENLLPFTIWQVQCWHYQHLSCRKPCFYAEEVIIETIKTGKVQLAGSILFKNRIKNQCAMNNYDPYRGYSDGNCQLSCNIIPICDLNGIWLIKTVSSLQKVFFLIDEWTILKFMIRFLWPCKQSNKSVDNIVLFRFFFITTLCWLPCRVPILHDKMIYVVSVQAIFIVNHTTMSTMNE